MPCFFPLQGYFADADRSGSVSLLYPPSCISFDKKDSWISDMKSLYQERFVRFPCGKCVGCHLDYSRSWAVRCSHEASLYSCNCFVTLTYDDDHIPFNRSFDKSHVPLFMKRLRRRFGEGIRYYGCAEYGSKLGRPHYHLCLFNFDFEDKVVFKVRKFKDKRYSLYVSDVLRDLWPYGFSTSASFSFKTAAYTARYVLKKSYTKSDFYGHSQLFNPVTGELCVRHKEYPMMSRNPGIGYGWYKKFYSDIYPCGFVIHEGSKIRTPRYYDKLFAADFPDEYAMLSLARRHFAENFVNLDDSTSRRLFDRNICCSKKLVPLIRDLDSVIVDLPTVDDFRFLYNVV